MPSILALALSVAVGLSLASTGGLAPVSVPDKSIRSIPVHSPIPLWLDGGNLVLGQPGLNVGTLSGTSMQPIMGEGHRLIWRNADWSQVQVGDILVGDESACRPLGASLAAHQVVEIIPTGGWRARVMWANGRDTACEVTADRVKGIAVGVLW